MDSLTQTNNFALDKRPTNCYRPIPHRWRVVLDYHLAGKSAEEIANITGYSLNSIYRILNHPNTVQIRQQLMESQQQEFDALFKKVTIRIREGLDDADPKIAAIFTNQWLRANGKLSDKQKGDIHLHLTAEDIIMQIKNGTYKRDE